VVSAFCAVLSAADSKHLINHAGALTDASPRPVNAIALDFARDAAARQFSLAPEDFAGVFLEKEYKSDHNGVTHFVYGQRFLGIDVYNAAWTVNVDRDGRVLNAGGRLYPRPSLAMATPLVPTVEDAAKAAGSESGAEGGKLVWFGLQGRLRPAWLVHTVDPDGVRVYATVVDGANRHVLHKRDLTRFQIRQSARGLVFEGESPQPNPNTGVAATSAPPIVERTLQSFDGDPIASPAGWVAGNTTVGNNTVTGANPLARLLVRDVTVATAADRNFSFPLQHGPGTASLAGFPDASTANLFYWVNRSHDLFYQAGFNEAAGNYQENNFGKGGIGGDPMLAYSFFAAAPAGTASLQNAFYTNRGDLDGTPSMIAFFLSYGADGGFTDNSFDAITVVHEYAHGVSNRLVKQLFGHQGASMGEGWSDFYSMEFLLPDGAPLDGVYPYSEYPEQSWGVGIRSRPYSTRTDINPLTYGELGRVFRFPEVHADGEIFALALWEVRANLIRQLGEREGRRRVRLLVLDGMKLAPPDPSMVDVRDAILLADRAAFDGASQSQIWAGFAKRGLGVLAYSESANTVHVVASGETPSNTGQLRFHESLFMQGEVVRIILHDNNLSARTAVVQVAASSGDVEDVTLTRQGLIYVGAVPTSTNPANRQNGTLNLAVGDSISGYYLDSDTGGAGPAQVETSVPTLPTYSLALGAPAFQFAAETNLNFRAPFYSRTLLTLPFAFPFFGRKYQQVWLYNNGLLSFGLPVESPCTDIQTLAGHAAIAPMWLEMNTLGFAQQNEGVFISRAAQDSITIRWAGGLDVGLGFRAEPVNFAVTLREDGRITYRYGPGNRNLALGRANSSCSEVSTPTVGLSNGHDIYGLFVPTHSGLGSLENAQTAILDPAFGSSSIPTGTVDASAGGDVTESVTLSGAVVDTSHPISRVDVYVDGVYVSRGALFANPRPAACAQQPATATCLGFTTTLSTSGLSLAEGEHKAWFRVTNTRGGFGDFPAEPLTFQVSRAEPTSAVGALEAPLAGAEVSGMIQVRGWTYGAAQRVVAVDVLIDGVTYGRAAYGQVRNDICNNLDPRPAACPAIGFQAAINSLTGLVPLVNGEHRLQFRAQDALGRHTLLPAEPVVINVNNAANARPVGVLTSHNNNDRVSGRVSFSGHAYDLDGRIVRVSLVVDDVIRANAMYGGDRSEVCAALEGVAACPRIGFDIDFDTRPLANGLHSVYFLAVDDRGAITQFPAIANAGINLYVEN
jgi:hypothetical protein